MYVRVKVFPDFKKELLEETGENQFRFYTREPAQDNRANKRVCEVIANHYGVSPDAVHIVSGHHFMNKRLQVHKNPED